MANNISVVGRLGSDAEKRFTPAGKAFIVFNVAENIFYRGEKRTQWYSCSMFGSRAEAVQPYLVKGAAVVIFGEFASNMGSDGKTYLNISVNSVELVGPRQQQQQVEEATTDEFTFSDDEIPF